MAGAHCTPDWVQVVNAILAPSGLISPRAAGDELHLLGAEITQIYKPQSCALRQPRKRILDLGVRKLGLGSCARLPGDSCEGRVRRRLGSWWIESEMAPRGLAQTVALRGSDEKRAVAINAEAVHWQGRAANRGGWTAGSQSSLRLLQRWGTT